MHPATRDVLQWFSFAHHSPDLQDVVRPFSRLAMQVAQRGGGPECTAALRHLLEAKDAAVRAFLALQGGADARFECLDRDLKASIDITVGFSESEIREMLDKEMERRGWTVTANPNCGAPPNIDEEG